MLKYLITVSLIATFMTSCGFVDNEQTSQNFVTRPIVNANQEMNLDTVLNLLCFHRVQNHYIVATCVIDENAYIMFYVNLLHPSYMNILKYITKYEIWEVLTEFKNEVIFNSEESLTVIGDMTIKSGFYVNVLKFRLTSLVLE